VKLKPISIVDTMKHAIFFRLLFTGTLSFVCHNAEGFTHFSLTNGTTAKHLRSNLFKNRNGKIKIDGDCIENAPAILIRPNLALSASEDDESGGDSKNSGSSNKIEDDELGDYDFEAGFQARLQKEGGRSGVQVKAAKRSAESVSRGVTKSVQSSAKQSKQTLSLLSSSEWYLTVGFLALVVVLAVGTHFASTEPFETSTSGEQLGFGVR